jgi:hypothetical protein
MQKTLVRNYISKFSIICNRRSVTLCRNILVSVDIGIINMRKKYLTSYDASKQQGSRGANIDNGIGIISM